MEKPIWFDETYYLNAKLTQMQGSDPDYTMDQLKAELATAGLDAYAHYDAYGDSEGLSPNLYFDRGYYMDAKLAQMQKTDPNYTMEQLEAEFKAAGLTAGEHYELYGYSEGLNPSLLFDQGKYMADKLAQMQKTDPDYTMAQLEAALEEVGLSPLDHYLSYGKDEGLTPRPVTKDWVLTTGVDKIAGAEDNDAITGVASALAKEATLNAGDQIDGGAGNDTLDVTMDGNFTGFTGDGFMKNVENVNLTNEGKIARTFTAKGVEGVEVYNVKGAIDLAGIAADVAVNLSDRASGTATIAYASKATDGTDDTLALGLSAMGTAEVKDADGKITMEQKAVTVNAAGIENLNVTAAGTNVVDLSGVTAAKAVTIAGEGDIKVVDLAASVKTVDAAALTGDLDINMASTGKATSVVAGAGDDVIRAGEGNLAADAEIDGGEGADKLVLNGKLGTAQYQMSNVETVEFNAATTTFSTKYASGIEKIVVKGESSDIKLADMDDLNLTLSGAGTGTVVSDHDGNTVMKVTGGTKDAAVENETHTVFSDSTSVELTVAQYNELAGDISAAKATSFIADVAGALNDTITLKEATSAVLTMTSDRVEDASNVVLDAAKLLDLQVSTGDASFTLTGTLGKVQSLTVDADGNFTATPVTFGDVATVDLSGNGSIMLDTLGDQAQNEYGITVNATGLDDGLTITKIQNGSTADVNVSSVKGDVEITNILSKEVTFIGSSLGKNTVSVTADKATLSGGIADDDFTIGWSGTSGTSTTKLFTAKVEVTGGLGDDNIAVGALDGMANNSNTIISIVDYNKGDTFTSASKFAVLDKTAAVKVLETAGISSTAKATDITLINVDLDDAGDKYDAADNYAFTYNGNTYLLLGDADEGFNSKEALVQLSGVQDADTLTGFSVVN